MKRTLEIIHGREMVFNNNAFNQKLLDYRQNSLKRYNQDSLLREVSEFCHVNFETVRKWYKGKNGPSDIGIVKRMAEFFDADYTTLLEPKVSTKDFLTDLMLAPSEFESDYMFTAKFSTISFSTVKFICMLNELAQKLKNGIVDFDTYTAPDPNIDGKILYAKLPHEPSKARIILDSIVDCEHHDIISYYDDYIDYEDSYRVTLILDELDVPYITVFTMDNEFIVEPGRWYFC